MSDNVPAGWYPTPTGGQRYWDGERWTNLPWEGDTATVQERPTPKGKLSKRALMVIAGVGILLVALVGGGVAWKVAADQQAAAEVVAAEEAAQAKEDAAKAAQDRRDQAERQDRADSVAEIENSVSAMATGHAADGVIDGPIIDVSCSPVGGGSTDDLSEKTTVFECFVANKDNGDGTMSGYYYNATINWDTGSYTYGLGRP